MSVLLFVNEKYLAFFDLIIISLDNSVPNRPRVLTPLLSMPMPSIEYPFSPSNSFSEHV